MRIASSSRSAALRRLIHVLDRMRLSARSIVVETAGLARMSKPSAISVSTRLIASASQLSSNGRVNSRSVPLTIEAL